MALKPEVTVKLEENIEETATRVCDAMAGAIELYASISGIAFDATPECFVSSYVFATLGPVLTMTMETNSTDLWKWNCNGRPTDQPTPAAAAEFKNGRVDLVLYRGDHSKKSETHFLSLVEFKTGNDIGPDARKIQDWLRFLDTCPWGMACGLVKSDDAVFLNRIQTEADDAGDKLVKGRVARPLPGAVNLQTLARIMTNPSYRLKDAEPIR